MRVKISTDLTNDVHVGVINKSKIWPLVCVGSNTCCVKFKD